MEATPLAAKAADASALGVDDGGGGVLVIVTVVRSGVTMVNVMDFGASIGAAASVAVSAPAGVVTAAGKDKDSVVVDGAASVVSDDVTSDRMATTGSSVDDSKATLIVGRTDGRKKDAVVLRPVAEPARKDSKLLTTVASEIVSGSSSSDSVS